MCLRDDDVGLAARQVNCRYFHLLSGLLLPDANTILRHVAFSSCVVSSLSSFQRQLRRDIATAVCVPLDRINVLSTSEDPSSVNVGAASLVIK
jgi:hypothetical protein